MVGIRGVILITMDSVMAAIKCYLNNIKLHYTNVFVLQKCDI